MTEFNVSLTAAEVILLRAILGNVAGNAKESNTLYDKILKLPPSELYDYERDLNEILANCEIVLAHNCSYYINKMLDPKRNLKDKLTRLETKIVELNTEVEIIRTQLDELEMPF